MHQRTEPSGTVSAQPETDPTSLDQLARELLAYDASDSPGRGREEAREAIDAFAAQLYYIKLTYRLNRTDLVARFWHAWHALLDEADNGPQPDEMTAASEDMSQAACDSLSLEDHSQPDGSSISNRADPASQAEANKGERPARSIRQDLASQPAGDSSGGTASASTLTIGTPGASPQLNREAQRRRDTSPQRLRAYWDENLREHEALDYVLTDDDTVLPRTVWELMHLGLLRLPEEEAARRRRELLGVVGDTASGTTRGLVPPCQALSSRGIALHTAELTDSSIGSDIHEAVKRSPLTRSEYQWLAIATSDLLFLGEFDRSLGINMLGIKTGDGLQALDDQLWPTYSTQLLDRVKALAEARDQVSKVRSLVRVDEMLAGLVPNPLPESYSWWQKRRTALIRGLQEEIAALGGEVVAVGGAHAAAEAVTHGNVSVPAPPGQKPGDVLWILRTPYRTRKGENEVQPGRMIFARSESAALHGSRHGQGHR
jgi:hypothetical protein